MDSKTPILNTDLSSAFMYGAKEDVEPGDVQSRASGDQADNMEANGAYLVNLKIEENGTQQSARLQPVYGPLNNGDNNIMGNNSNRSGLGSYSSRNFGGSGRLTHISTMNRSTSDQLGLVRSGVAAQKDAPHAAGEARLLSEQADIFLQNFKTFFMFMGDWISQGERESLEAKVKQIRDGDYPPGCFIDYRGFSLTPLHWAVLMDDTGIALDILEADTVDVQGDYGYNSILHLAVGCGNREIVRELLPYISDLNKPNSHGSTALHWAVQYGHIGIVDVNEKDVDGKTVLHWAVEGGNIHMVMMVLGETYVDMVQDIDVWAKDNAGNTALHLAVEGEMIDVVIKLLEYQPILEIGVVCFKDTQRISKNKLGQTALHVALKKKNIDIVRKLLTLALNWPGLDLDTHLTTLHWAVKFANADKDLSERFTLLGFEKDFDIERTFMLGDIDIVRGIILEGNVDVHAKDIDGRTALHMAIEGGNIDIVREFLEHKDKSKLTQETWNGKTPIEIAYEIQDHDIEQVLMECDAVSRSVEHLYRDRQVYVDAANAILVGAALIASVTFASWLQPPNLSYSSYNGELHVDVENNPGLRAFWIFNCLAFYFATGTVVFGACSVLPRRNLYIKQIVKRLRSNLFITSILLTLSVFFVIIAFGIAGCIVLTPVLKYQWYMIGPTILGGTMCLLGLGVLAINIWEDRHLGNKRKND
jgi:ankyrin repeat protein